MPKPPGTDVDRDIGYFRERGVGTIVSLLEPPEAAALSLGNEGDVCRANGLRFVQFGIPDFGVPDTGSLLALVERVTGMLENGDSVGVHCRAGIGRSGLLACAVLVGLGQSAEAAIRLTSQARGVQVPETPEQTEMVKTIARLLAT